MVWPERGRHRPSSSLPASFVSLGVCLLPLEKILTTTPFLTKHRLIIRKKHVAKMPISTPNNLPKIENLRSILHAPQNNNNSYNLTNSNSRSSGNSQRNTPFCVHGDLFGRHPGASYHCRSDHHSRTPTPATTPHSERSWNSLNQDEGTTARRGSWARNDKEAADVFFTVEEEKGLGPFAPEKVQ